VVQQARGQVRSTTQAKGSHVHQDSMLEREADQMGAKAARGEPVSMASSSHAAMASTPSGAAAQPMQRKPDDTKNPQQSSDAEGSGSQASDNGDPAAGGGLSPRARAVLKRLGMTPKLPPDAAAKLSKGMELIAGLVANQRDEGRPPDHLSYRIQEDDYQLAFEIQVDAHTRGIRVLVAFRDSGNREFLGSFHEQAPDQGVEAPVVRNPEIPDVVSAFSITTLDVARSLFGGTAPKAEASAPSGTVGGAQQDDPESAALKAELERVEAELAAAEKEVLVLMADTALDVAGIFDPTPISDGLATIRDLSRGDYVGASTKRPQANLADHLKLPDGERRAVHPGRG
jgi:hypothetical protein